jgi:hypothetical protein
MLMKEGIDTKQKEINVYDKVIAEIETSYEHILYSEDFYVDETSQNYWKTEGRIAGMDGREEIKIGEGDVPTEWLLIGDGMKEQEISM